MTTFRIDLDEREATFAPGEVVRGTVYWTRDERPKHVEINLFWFTRGKGTQDFKVVDRQRVEAPGRQGSQSFALQLPLAPLSYSGHLVSICWGVEAMADSGDDSARAELKVDTKRRAERNSSGSGAVSAIPSFASPAGPER